MKDTKVNLNHSEKKEKNGIKKGLREVKKSAQSLRISPKEVITTIASFTLCAMFTFWYNDYKGLELAGRIIILLGFYLIFILYSGRRISGQSRSDAEVMLLTVLVTVYYIASSVVRDIKLCDGFLPVSIIMPTTLIIMIISICIDSRIAYTLALILPLGAFIIGSFNPHSYIAALSSAIAGAFILRQARRRMDLIKAGYYVALIDILITAAVITIQKCPLSYYPAILFWSAINGIVSGMLVLGILPIIENALHLATTFRLIELLDIGTPILRKLASTAPGTWAHSMAVATMADEACREIGAKALLARVGAYYHDIGKIDQSSYFVENQSEHNKHDELNPRLSATVIRSHVKLGVEKARAMGLPREVIDIISQHHGDSSIEYFYNAAVKKEGDGVDREDFCYPGKPPRTKESAVVMLADTTEAAARTLENPTLARLEKFVQTLFDGKVEHGQLSESDLTFHDLEIIKKSFVRVLVSNNHHRIKYPSERS